MFSDEFLSKVFSHPDMQKIPVGAQATAVSVFEDILSKEQEVNPYVCLSELLSGADSDEPAAVSEF